MQPLPQRRFDDYRALESAIADAAAGRTVQAVRSPRRARWVVIALALLAAAGDPNVKEDLLKGKTVGSMTYKVHLDGYNILPLLTGETEESPRKEIFYFSDDGDLTALRYDDWKLIFMEQKATGTFRVWMEPFVPLRVPLILNLRRDPYERAPITSNSYFDWMLDRAFLLVPAQAFVGNFLATFKEYPPRMKAASFSLDQVMEKVMNPSGAQ